MKQNELTLNEYQRRAMSTCLSTCENDAYMLLNLVGEVGELTSKIAKAVRKNFAYFGPDGLIRYDTGNNHDTEQLKIALRKEAGDCLWQLSGFCSVMGWKLCDVAQENLDKLASRKDRGLIDGNGDDR